MAVRVLPDPVEGVVISNEPQITAELLGRSHSFGAFVHAYHLRPTGLGDDGGSKTNGTKADDQDRVVSGYIRTTHALK